MAISYSSIRPKVEQLRADVELSGHASEDADGLRPFHMLAYTGASVSRLYGSAVFDLGGIERNEQVPILLNHDETQICGFADSVQLTERGLEVSGRLSRVTEAGRQVAALSDEGLRWQASVGLAVSEWDEVASGATVKLNGQEFSGPVSVGRKSRLLEVSFVTAGADHRTTAVALAAKEGAMPCPNCEALEAKDDEDEEKKTAEDMAEDDSEEKDEKKKDDEDMAAAEVEKLRAEVASLRSDLAGLASLKAAARHPGVGFDGPARESLTSKPKPTTSDEAWESDERLRAEFFNHKPVFDAFVRREGWSPEK